MALNRLLVSAALLPALALPALAQDAPAPASSPVTVQSSVTLTLGTTRDAEKRTIAYTCEGAEPFSVDYINAVPNFLALVPIEGETMIFAAVLSASGARYVAGEYEWWTQGPEATLRNIAEGEDAPPLATCSEFSNTP
jgi:membrane-bound inhibitor of C-type lysozyme